MEENFEKDNDPKGLFGLSKAFITELFLPKETNF